MAITAATSVPVLITVSFAISATLVIAIPPGALIRILISATLATPTSSLVICNAWLTIVHGAITTALETIFTDIVRRDAWRGRNLCHSLGELRCDCAERDYCDNRCNSLVHGCCLQLKGANTQGSLLGVRADVQPLRLGCITPHSGPGARLQGSSNGYGWTPWSLARERVE